LPIAFEDKDKNSQTTHLYTMPKLK